MKKIRKWLRLPATWVDSLALLATVLLLLAIFSAASSRFWTLRTMAGIANQIPALAIVTAAMTCVLIVGSIDLSVGAVMGLAGAVFGVLALDYGWSVPAAAAASLGAAAGIGAVNGWVTTRWRVPSFVVTLGMMEAVRGLTYWVSHTQTQYLGTRLDWLGSPLAVAAVSPAVLLAIVVTVCCHVVLRKTQFGRHCFAAGDNPVALELSGVDPRHCTRWVFVAAGALAGLAGLVQAARLSTADPNAGIGMELSAIAAAVIAGTSLTGGRGSVLRSLLGVILIATLQTGLSHVGASEPMKRLVTGLVIVVAAVGDSYRRRWFQPVGGRSPN